MSVILKQGYGKRDELKRRGVLCLSEEEALRADIRPLRIGIINIMPKAEAYEPMILHPLSRSIIQIDPIWIRLHTHVYRSSNHQHLAQYYCWFEDAIAQAPLDGLVLTGAPVEEIPFEQVRYWDELSTILTFAHHNIHSTLGICWGGLALAKMIGFEKIMLGKKLFGAFETRNLDISHRITGQLDDVFWCPQSRFAGLSDKELEKQSGANGIVRLLAHAPETGYTIIESADHRYLMHLGHPEYEARRLVFEYQRDVARGKKGVEPPRNIDLNEPLNRWRTHTLEFFQQWIRFLFEFTTAEQ